MEITQPFFFKPTSGFGTFLGGFDRDRFFAEHWERRSLHIRHGDPERFAHLISHESFFETEIKRCAHLKASTRGPDGWNQEIRIQPEQAYKLFRAGMTICATMLDEKGPCEELIEAYRDGITSAAPPHVNCYYSPDQRGYGLHFDTHPVWILQVAGSKQWTVSFEPAVKNPPFNLVYPPGRDRVKLPWITMDRPDTEDPDKFMHLRLDPGDVLYLPAGCWHAARAEGSSLALTLALGRVTTLDLLTVLLGEAATQRVPGATTRLAPFARAQPLAASREDVLEQISEALDGLKDLVRRFDAGTLMRVYEHLAEHPEAILAHRHLTNAKGQVELMKAHAGAAPADVLAAHGS
jgi:50S ribosomal protein L16 3-hydroxylase